MKSFFQISLAALYDRGQGFVIERQFDNGSEVFWAIPAWDEMNMPDCEGVFPTEQAARDALNSY
jgi:hypothetical protein